MRIKKTLLCVFALLVVFCTIISTTIIGTSALENKYYIEELKMSVKVPKDYTVITVQSERGDEAFDKLNLDYDETMTAFYAADIYLQAFDSENKHKITLTMIQDDDSKTVNNYSEITPTQRQTVLDSFLSQAGYVGGVEKKYNGNIFFELDIEKETDEQKVFARQCNTVINGMNINVTLQKSDEELTNDETKVLSNLCNTINFDKITLNNGPQFDWWRIILWVLIVAAICFVISLWYKKKNEENKRKLLERKMRSRAKVEPMIPHHPEFIEEKDLQKAEDDSKEKHNPLLDSFEDITFDEALGYGTSDEFLQRAATDLESYDINVKEKNVKNGVKYFEDGGKSIDDTEDYFDTYFKEQRTPRKKSEKFFSAVWTYIQIFFRHVGYFFKNLGKNISKSFTDNKTNR